jgi:hypothetical protein
MLAAGRRAPVWVLILVTLCLASGVALVSNGTSSAAHHLATKLKVPHGHLYYVCTCPRCPPDVVARCHPERPAYGNVDAGRSLLLWSEIVFGGMLVGGTSWHLWRSRRRRGPPVSAVIPRGRLEMRRRRQPPRDSREVVLAAVADLENRLSALGHSRDPAELPESYLRSVLPSALVDGPLMRSLMHLYSKARYSGQSISTRDAAQAELASEELSKRAGDLGVLGSASSDLESPGAATQGPGV